MRRELEVLCLPGAIPEAITVDITELNIGDSVHVSDIKVGEGVGGGRIGEIAACDIS